MPTLQALYDKLDDIPEPYRELYSERSGKFEITGISGVKTQADVDRLQTALSKERDEHKQVKTTLSVWGDLKHEDVAAQLDRIPELEAAAKGKLDEAQIDEIVNRRVDGTLKSKVGPLERQIGQLTKERDEAMQIAGERGEYITKTKIGTAVRTALIAAKAIPEAHDDALMLAERLFEVREDDGAIITRDQVGVTPGLSPEAWLQEIQEKRPHWWPLSTGGGAPGGGRGGNTGIAGGNPWSSEHWNMSRQGQILNSKGEEYAQQLAKAAGTTVGGLKPVARAGK